MASPASTARRSRRTKIATTVGALALVGAAGGYGTYAAFTDTTTLAGSASAGTVQLNDSGADSRTINISGLLPGDSPSACFVVAAPTAGNTQPLSVALTAENTTITAGLPANVALSSALNVGLERVAGTDADFSANGATGGTTTLTRTSNCTAVATGTGTALTTRAVTALGSLTDSFTLAPGASQVYRVTVNLPTNVVQAAAGGAASFRLTWTGSAGA